jgi:hypothetical protein
MRDRSPQHPTDDDPNEGLEPPRTKAPADERTLRESPPTPGGPDTGGAAEVAPPTEAGTWAPAEGGSPPPPPVRPRVAKTPPVEPPASPLPDELADLKDYDIVRELGRGGMGMVYLAHNRLLGRDEVLKVMGRDLSERSGMLDRFLREIRAVARLRHANIVAAYSAFSCGPSLVFAMEYVQGLDLARMVEAKGPLPVRHSCHFAQQVAQALQHAHEEGLVHRDIKPGNLMLTGHKDRAVIKVLDFGLAKASREGTASGDLTLAGMLLGTPHFMAPEQIDDARGADIRADIYSLGCTLYCLLTGHPPFAGMKLYDILRAQHATDATPLDRVRPEVPAGLSAVVAKMMAKEPGRRFQTPAEVARALAPYARGGKGASKTPGFETTWADAAALPQTEVDGVAGSLTTGIDRARRRPLAAVLAGVAALAAIVIVAFLAGLARRREPAPAGARPAPVAGASSAPADGNLATRIADVPKVGPSKATDSAPPAPPVGTDERRSVAIDAGSSVEKEGGSMPVAPREARPTGSLASADAAGPAPSPKVEVKATPARVKSPRWDWIHDVSLAAFDRWVDGLRARGYCPVFANGHDIATRAHIDGVPDAPGEARIAAIAVKAGGPAFHVALDRREEAFLHNKERAERGFDLCSLSTFTNGSMEPYVLAVYQQRERLQRGYWGVGHRNFPEPFLTQRIVDGNRPYLISGRPAGKTWAVILATRRAEGVPWKVRAVLDAGQLRRVLGEAREGGFRPDSLFVCPSGGQCGFGVLLTRDDPDRLWEVGIDLTLSRLELETTAMAARGYAPEQVVGYEAGGGSRYLACWSRDPRNYPATGLVDPSLEAVDEALEQLLVDHRVPSCTFAAFRDGRPVLSRGYGHADRSSREPIGPDAARPLGDLSAFWAAAAVQAIVEKKKGLRGDAPLTEVLRAPAGGAVAKGPAPQVSVSELLEGFGRPDSRLGEAQRRALAAMVFEGGSAPAAMTDRHLRGAVLGRVLEAVTGKPPAQAIAAEVIPAPRPHRRPAEPATEGWVSLSASAAEVGRFFLKHHLDGRPLSHPARPSPVALIGREGDSLALVLGRDDLLLVVLLRLPEGARKEFVRDLRAGLERAVDALPVSHPPSARRRSAP